MFRKRLVVISLFIISLCCTSCFEVIEEIYVAKDGSGHMTLTVNFSQSKTKIAAAAMLDSVNGHKVPEKEDIQQSMDETVALLQKIPGISNVKKTADYANYVASVSFSFKEVSDVNRISKTIMEQYEVKNANVPVYGYNRSTTTFSRDYHYSGDVKTQFNKLSNRDKEIFRSANYISIFRFESPIANYSNKTASISKNKQAAMQRCSVLDLINGKVSISNQVQLSK